MPELPDIQVYLDALEERLLGQVLLGVRVRSPSLLRTVDPPLSEVAGKPIVGVRRIGKRIVLALEDDLFLVIHLMIAGRLHWKKPNVQPAGRNDMAAFHFDVGTLMLTEASSKKRSQLHVIRGEAGLLPFDRGGLDVLTATPEAFREVLLRENHTIKRTLTDPRLFDGIGNAFSDEILHAAQLSPMTWTTRLTDEQTARLYTASRAVLTRWIDLLRADRGQKFPEKVTAFRPEMAVHGKYREPCPVCTTPVQRIQYADEHQTNYCPTCQTGGKLLADRAMSRLLREDWPRTLEELEELKERQRF